MGKDLTLTASLASLSPLAAWLEAQTASLPVSDAWRFALDLAVCEAATNIIRHGLNEDSRRAFAVTFSVNPQEARVCFTDSGKAFPDERLATARLQLKEEMAPDLESGRGLMLILLSVDDFTVRRQGDLNLTTLVKRLDEAA